MSIRQDSGMTWPTHGSGGLHDWWTYLERGIVEPFKDAIRDMRDVDIPFEGGGTMLMQVLPFVRGGPWLEIVSLLIKGGADVNRRNQYGIPVWGFAPTSGPSCVELWRELIQAGLAVNSRGAKQETPLIYLCSGYLDPATDRSFVVSRLTVVQLLLDAGAEVNVMDQYNVSPLRAVANAGYNEIVKLLLKAGADPNLVGSGTRSALFEAALHGYAGIVQALLEHYAKENRLEPTEAELDAFVRRTEAMKRREQARLEKDRERLVHELNSPSLTERERSEKTSRLHTIERILKMDEEVEALTRGMEEALRANRRNIARHFVKSWKINKSLYEKYGGRVIFQQAGVEPLDAYRAFLKEQEKKGAFHILNQEDAASFWRYFTQDAMHTFYSKDDGAKFMQTPWWLMDEPTSE